MYAINMYAYAMVINSLQSRLIPVSRFVILYRYKIARRPFLARHIAIAFPHVCPLSKTSVLRKNGSRYAQAVSPDLAVAVSLTKIHSLCFKRSYQTNIR